MADTGSRRPLKSRSSPWAQGLAKALGNARVSPNAISTIGILFAAAGAAAMLATGESRWLWLGGALGVQLRLLCNLLDGLVAVEGGKGSSTGPLYNELPDRLEDALLIIAASYGAGVPALGYGATILAFGTAYVRATGGALGFPQDFVGPMAKQHRMFVLTVGCLLSAFITQWPVMEIALWVIALGSAATCLVRTARIAALLKARAG